MPKLGLSRGLAICRHPGLASQMQTARKTGRFALPGIRFASTRKGRWASLALAADLVMLELLADPRRLAGTRAQVIQLGTAHVALALDLDGSEQWRVRL